MGSFLNKIMSRIEAAKGDTLDDDDEDKDPASREEDATTPEGMTVTGKEPSEIITDPTYKDLEVDKENQDAVVCDKCKRKGCKVHQNLGNNNFPSVSGNIKESSNPHVEEGDRIKKKMNTILRNSGSDYHDLQHNNTREHPEHGVVSHYTIRHNKHSGNEINKILNAHGVHPHPDRDWYLGANQAHKNYYDFFVHHNELKESANAYSPELQKDLVARRFTEHDNIRHWKKEARARFGKVTFNHDAGLGHVSAHAEGKPTRVGMYSFAHNRGYIGEEVENIEHPHKIIKAYVDSHDKRRKDSPHAEYHKDGSATVHIKHSQKYKDVTSTQRTDGFLMNHGFWFNHSAKALENHTQTPEKDHGVPATDKGYSVHVKKTDTGHSVHLSHKLINEAHDVFHHHVFGKVLYDKKNDKVATFDYDGAHKAADEHESNGGKVIGIHKHPFLDNKAKKRYYVQTSYRDKTTI